MSSSIIAALSRPGALHLALLVAGSASFIIATRASRLSSRAHAMQLGQQTGDKQLADTTGTLAKLRDVWVDAFDMETCGRALFRPWQEKESAFNCSSSQLLESQVMSGRQDGARLLGGNSIVGPRIINGANALEGEFPSYVKQNVTTVLNGSRFHCGATLIDKDYVVTAAHCVFGWSEMSLTFGSNRLDGIGGVVRGANKWCYPSVYNPRTLANDLAIIRLDKPIEYELNKIWPACLKLDARHSPEATCAFVGLGRIGPKEKDPAAEHLQTLPAERTCGPTSESKSCYMGTAEVDGLQGAFEGDSGSPIICYDHCAQDASTRAFAVAAVSGGPLEIEEDRPIPVQVADFNLLRDRFLDLLEAAGLEGEASLEGTTCGTSEPLPQDSTRA